MIIVYIFSLALIYFYGIRKFQKLTKSSCNVVKKVELKYTVSLIIIYGLVSLIIVYIIGQLISHQIIKYYIYNYTNINIPNNNIVYESVQESLKMLPNILIKNPNLEGLYNISHYIDNKSLLKLYKEYNWVNGIIKISIGIISTILGIIILNKLFNKLKVKFNSQSRFENFIKKLLFISSLLSIVATFTIISTLLWETILFLEQVPLFNFLFGTTWLPQNSSFDIKNSFSILPLLTGTFLIALIACVVALFIAVPAAIYMAEFMPKNLKNIVKPILEILSGIPTIVYGFFAALVLAPKLVNMFKYFNISVSNESAIVAGLVIGIMIIPFISSSTDDIISSIPKSIREGSYALGSMSYQVVLKILFPIAFPGIFSSLLLAFSRAIGETMIVVMASGLVANLTFNPFEPVTTITTQMVIISQGDQDFSCVKTLSLFALGFTLFCVTLILNLFSFWVIKRFQTKY